MAPLIAMAGLLSLCQAEEIAVLVISAKNGQPLVERRVQLYISQWAQEGDKSSSTLLFNEWVYTDGSGSARFKTSFPIPEDASLFVGGATGDYCSPAHYLAREVLQKGASVAHTGSCPHRPLKRFVLPPRPGQIVIYSGEYSVWERALYFPWPS